MLFVNPNLPGMAVGKVWKTISRKEKEGRRKNTRVAAKGQLLYSSTQSG